MHGSVSLNILVVEDNDSLREATVDFLQQNGHRATGVVSAEDVDDTPMTTVPDLYLVDVNLPGENGFSLAKRLRQAQPSVGIVLMTARGQLNDRLEGYQRGADHYLIKPVEQAELLACISNLGFRLKPLAETSPVNVTVDSKTLLLRGPEGELPLVQGEYTLLVALCRAAGHQLERWQAMELLDPGHKGLVPANLGAWAAEGFDLSRKVMCCDRPA